MKASGRVRLGGVLALLLAGAAACRRAPEPQRAPVAAGAGGAGGAPAARIIAEPVIPSRVPLAPLADGEVYVYGDSGAGTPATKMTLAEASAKGLLIVDLGDGWAPFIFQDGGATKGDAAKPNGYRKTFVELANDRVDEDGKALRAGEGNFLEPFGIPPTLSVLSARIEADRTAERRTCEAVIDWDGIRAFSNGVGYQDRDHAKRDHGEALRDAEWLTKEIARREAAALAPASAGGRSSLASDDHKGEDKPVPKGRARAPEVLPPPATWKAGDRAAAITALGADADPKVSRRVARALRGQERLRAVKALQAFLSCEDLLSPRAKTTAGSFDLPTHEALAAWERRNDIFGWGMLGGETQAALPRPTLELDYETFRRVLAERVADAAGIVEDGSTSGNEAGYKDAAGNAHAVPNLIEDHVNALLAAIHVAGPGDLIAFLRQHGAAGLASLRVAFHAPPLPPYYEATMDISAVIDRGDVWYDFPFDAKGKPIEQPRSHYPHLMVFANWHGQRIPLVSWRTTIGSWRSEVHANGKAYYKYKNSDVGSRVWKNIVAGPCGSPPDGTPVKDLLKRVVLDRDKGPETVVNTGVMGPGFQSAYGLVMAIHIDRGGFDNQIRTHGSVDYTSIARRFSHGCHRLVNDRAVRLFDFVLRHRTWKRIGDVPLHMTRKFSVDGQDYHYRLATRGYYYELDKPVPVDVTEGRVMGQIKKPIADYVRKAGVDYEDVADPGAADSTGPRKARRPADPSSGDATASPEAIGGSRAAAVPETNEPSPTPLEP